MAKNEQGKLNKKVYHKPNLDKIGNLLDVTLGGAVGKNDSGGSQIGAKS